MRSFIAALAVAALLLGGAALAYARWTRPVADGDAALAAGQLERALPSYSTARGRFDGVPVARSLFAGDYLRVVSTQLGTLYHLGRYDDTIDRADRAPEDAFPHFWSGCAFFQKAAAEEKADARLGWLTRAEEELRKA